MALPLLPLLIGGGAVLGAGGLSFFGQQQQNRQMRRQARQSEEMAKRMEEEMAAAMREYARQVEQQRQEQLAFIQRSLDETASAQVRARRAEQEQVAPMRAEANRAARQAGAAGGQSFRRRGLSGSSPDINYRRGVDRERAEMMQGMRAASQSRMANIDMGFLQQRLQALGSLRQRPPIPPDQGAYLQMMGGLGASAGQARASQQNPFLQGGMAGLGALGQFLPIMGQMGLFEARTPTATTTGIASGRGMGGGGMTRLHATQPMF